LPMLLTWQKRAVNKNHPPAEFSTLSSEMQAGRLIGEQVRTVSTHATNAERRE
jgi:hypothetical protein